MGSGNVRALLVFALFGFGTLALAAETIPRPEHPTPDAVRPHWANLNGSWEFRFDPKDEGRDAGWEKPGAEKFDGSIVVPFPWESELSGVKKPEYHGVAWYRREFTVPSEFPKIDRVWLRFGAVDWRADVWVNGTHVAKHEGGYTPFEADITDALKSSEGKPAVVTVRVFDPTNPAQPVGKQVGWYTTTSGIWQTVWLEARPKARIAHFTIEPTHLPKLPPDPTDLQVSLLMADLSAGKYTCTFRPDDPSGKVGTFSLDFEIPRDEPVYHVKFDVLARDAELWTPENPRLHDVILELKAPDGTTDTIKTYVGLRTIARGKYGDAPYERILLNGKPIYLRTALDQSFNPKGIYTAPDDAFLKADIELAKQMGLNGLRIHIKPDEPRRLYWADKLGLLILEDMPNTWRQNAEARKGWESTMREVVARDINHPSIIAWVAFNETWGLGSPPDYKKDKDTQDWVGRMVAETRKLDPSRLVEDNSPCNYDHVENTDLNSWHFYIDDYAGAKRHIDEVVAKTEPGSGFNYCPGQVQGTAPLINSEYGGVSAGGGDRDVSWCFRDLTTLLRRQPKIQGYVYTELDDIEWEHNGFVNYDRTAKDFGYEAFVPGMTPFDLNGADFIGFNAPPVLVVKPGESITVPLFVSHFSDRKGPVHLSWWVRGHNDEGMRVGVGRSENRSIEWTDYNVKELEPVTFNAPDRPFVGALALMLRDERGERIAANFVNIVVKPDKPLPRAARQEEHEAVLRFEPNDFSRKHWSDGASTPEGKAYGRGKGSFEYKLKVPPAIVKARPQSITLRFELAAKAKGEKVDWPKRPNGQDYPQTDERKWPSTVEIALNGKPIARKDLPDDPADARGVLSHVNRFEHGSYGYLIEVNTPLSDEVKSALANGDPLVVRLAVPDDAKDAGGLCVFGASTGQYPFDPTLVIKTSDDLPKDLGTTPDEPVAIDRLETRRIVALAAGDSVVPAEWSYTTTDPGKGWSDPDFDASNWTTGKSGFGSEGTPGVRVATPWKTSSIWLRTTVDLPSLGRDDDLLLRIFHDEDTVVFVNGKQLIRRRGYINHYAEIQLDAAQKALFHPGKNTLAVSCHQTGGGQGIDVGLTLQKGE